MSYSWGCINDNLDSADYVIDKSCYLVFGPVFPCGRVGIYELDYKYDVRMRAAIKVSKVAVAGVYMAGTS